MKKVILLVLWNLALSAPMFYAMSCGPSREEIEQMEQKLELEKHPVRQFGNYQVLVIDGCEYIKYVGNSDVLTHKGNCKNKHYINTTHTE